MKKKPPFVVAPADVPILPKEPHSMTPFYEVGVLYSFTINPDDDQQFFRNKDRLKTFTDYIAEQFLAFPAKGIDYIYNIDISEPREINGNYPRLHLHGAMTFRNHKSIRWFLLMWIPGFPHVHMQVDTIGDLSVWRHYCEKYNKITGLEAFSNQGELWKYFADKFAKPSVAEEV